MLGQRAAHRSSKRQRRQSITAHVARELSVHVLEGRVSRRPDEKLVELAVEREEVVDPVVVDGLGLPLHEMVQVRDVLVREERHGEADRERLERLAHLIGLEELPGAERRDDRAAARADRHEPLGGEPPEGLADRSATDAEGRGERHLGEDRPRREPVGEDLVAQVRVDALPQGEVLDRTRADVRIDRDLRRRHVELRSVDPPSTAGIETRSDVCCQQSENDEGARHAARDLTGRKERHENPHEMLCGGGGGRPRGPGPQRLRLGRLVLFLGSRTPPAAAASISKMAIAAPEKANDYGWNQQGVESASAPPTRRAPRSRSPTASATRTWSRCSAGWRRAAAS